MSKPTSTIDDVLDLLADVREIDALAAADPQDGTVTFDLLCGNVVHCTLVVTEGDFAFLKNLLDANLTLLPKK